MIEYKQTIRWLEKHKPLALSADKLHGVRVDVQFDNFFFNSIM